MLTDGDTYNGRKERERQTNVKVDTKQRKAWIKSKRKSTKHTVEQSSTMDEEGVVLLSTSSASSSSFSVDIEVNGSILCCEKILLMKTTLIKLLMSSYLLNICCVYIWVLRRTRGGSEGAKCFLSSPNDVAGYDKSLIMWSTSSVRGKKANQSIPHPFRVSTKSCGSPRSLLDSWLWCRWCSDPESVASVLSLLSSRVSWSGISFWMSVLTSELVSQPCTSVSGLQRYRERERVR